MLAVVSLFDHAYDVPPFAVSVVAPCTQPFPAPVIVAAGAAFTVIVTG